MKTRTGFLVIIAFALLTGACKNSISYKKTKGGMPYKIFSSGDTTRIDTNDFVKMHYTTKLNDSVLITTFGKIPIYYQVVGMKQAYDISEIFFDLKKGDSVVTVQLMDTFLKRMPGRIDPRYKKGDRVITYVKIVDVIKSPEARMQDEAKVLQEYKNSEIKQVEDFIAKRGVKATRTRSGAFVEIIENGTGPEIDSGNYALARYRGTTFEGKEFDSNMGGPAYGFVPGAGSGRGGSIVGFDEGLQMLSLGDRARFYIPSMLGYGPRGSQDPMTGELRIPPYTNLIFEVVIDSFAVKPPPEMLQPTAPPTTLPIDSASIKKNPH